MVDQRGLVDAWDALPVGARVALDQQWAGLAAGGLPCGSAILDADDRILAAGRNRAYDPPGGIESRAHSPLQHTRLAHAELNAVALLATATDHASLTLWSTQHPCAMCAAAVRFVGIGKVRFVDYVLAASMRSEAEVDSTIRMDEGIMPLPLRGAPQEGA